jgi:hypothetical protein
MKSIPPGFVVVGEEVTRFAASRAEFSRRLLHLADGLDCIWLVNGAGKYLQTIDHDFLQKHFEVASKCRERNVYGRNRAKLLPIP